MTAHTEPPIPITDLRTGTTRVAQVLHVTGGIRAEYAGGLLWVWQPVISAGTPDRLRPLTFCSVNEIARELGAEVFGHDQWSGVDTPLISRIWTPLDGPQAGRFQPADLWSAIAGNADDAGDKRYAAVAKHIAFSLRAAGTRLRDASDHYHGQLLAAISEKRQPKTNFANIPMSDLQLAFHSVLSELASARDYLASAVANRLGAPEKIDAMNRLAEWLSAPARAHMRSKPVIAAMLEAYDPGSKDPWLYEITRYRNIFLHQQPLGASDAARWLRYDELEHSGIVYPRIEMPLGAGDPLAPGQDALLQFLRLYRRMTGLIDVAASHAAYSTTLKRFGAM